MDRLVCGDVGFGKTEVAVRAAFAAAVNGKQTLVLCPTTILAEQHWNTFKARYRDFPVRVEMVFALASRPRRQALRDFAEGKVEVLIGTHRVLPRRDPEGPRPRHPRRGAALGVAQKELLRSLRLEVDVLALSATPIPRTLYMSALRPARHLAHRDAARGPPSDPDDGRRVRRGADQDRPRAGGARVTARRSTCTTGSRRSRMRRRSCSSSARRSASSSRTGRCGNASWRRRCTPSSAATPTCSSRRRSSSRGSTSRRRTPLSSSARTRSG